MIMELWVGNSFVVTMFMGWSPTIKYTVSLFYSDCSWFHKQFSVESI